MKKKLCFVVQRYGVEINGGAEAYTRIYAEKLAQIYDVTAVSTCALDYQEWKNYYPEGMCEINGVTVRRFKVDYQRDNSTFGEVTGKIFNNPNHTVQQAYDWVKAQGPVSEGAIEFIKENKDNYDLFLFFTYLYYPTVFGIDAVKDKAILCPFCHDEPPVYLKCFDELFNAPKAIIYNTEEEEEFVHKRFKNDKIPSILTGIGLDIPPLDTLPDGKKQFKLNKPFILYMGRIDPAKGCSELFEYFLDYKKKYNTDIQLVLMGNELIPIPKHKDIISLGFVSEEEKYAVLRECDALVLPSHFESLSIVVLEAFAFKKPVLVSGHCAVLKGHCTKSNGGLYFYGNEDFAMCLDLLSNSKDLRDAMGVNGSKYVDERYQWDIIMDKMTNFIDEM